MHFLINWNLHSSKTRARWAEGFHDELNGHVFDLERDGLLQVLPCPWLTKKWNQFGMTEIFLSVPRYGWCAPLSHPSSCMLVNHGLWQQSSKEEYKPWTWGATARYYASHTKTMLPTRKSVPRSSHIRTTRRPPGHRKETQTAVVWSCLPFIGSGQNHLARHSERRKKTSQAEEEVGRQHKGMDRPGVHQVPEGSGEQGKMEETGCKIICGAKTTLAVKGQMMMMITHTHTHTSRVFKSLFWADLRAWFLCSVITNTLPANSHYPVACMSCRVWDNLPAA